MESINSTNKKKPTVLQSFANVIKRLRKAKGMSQEEFAFKCNSSQKYISDIELAKRSASLKFVKKCAYALNLTLQELFVMIDLEDREQNGTL